MKEITYYRCEVCWKEYPVKEEAIKCECSHTVPVSVALPKNYKQPMDEMYGCPRHVIVTMKNGVCVRYKYDGEARPYELRREGSEHGA